MPETPRTDEERRRRAPTGGLYDTPLMLIAEMLERIAIALEVEAKE